jgi:transcriptional regulator GlxA family with amidase domain
MEQTIETPQPREELARLANVSLRQLERLFRQHLGRSLGEHYLALRLDRARDLLRQTSLSVTETALACGFASASHFSRSYRERFDRSPRDERTLQPAVSRQR